MFSRFVALLSIAALAAVVAATPTNTCNSGSTYCCNQKFSNPTDFKKDPTSIVDLLVSVGANVGLTCTPVTVIGALSDGSKCVQQTACCKDVKQVGLVNVACSPIAVLV